MISDLARHPGATEEILLRGIADIPDGIILLDLEGAVLYLNDAATRITGWELDDALGKDAQLVFRVVNGITREPTWNPISQVLRDRQSYTLLPNSVLISKSGKEVPIEDTTSPIVDKSGAFIGVIVLFKDVSLSRWHLVKALRRAQHDPLTALPNRAALQDRILQALADIGSRSQMVCLLFIDIDKFKGVNDAMGHSVGDFVLQVVAGRLAAAIRSTDLICRVGGDEFVVLLAIPDGVDRLTSITESLLEAGRQPIEILGNATSIAFSIGIALRQEQGSDVAGFLADADAAAYRAKANGGNQARIFEQSFRTELTTDRILWHQMEEALAAKQYFLEYQPIVDCQTGKLAGVEALVRWRHPDGSVLQPINFIGAAERSGIMAQLGREILRMALEQRILWNQSGIRPFPISVNVSPVEIMSQDYMKALEELLIAKEYEAESLILEITESALIGAEQQKLLLPALRELKIKIAMDDFGTGYSNVGYLRAFSVDHIKIDKSFVSGVSHSMQDAILVKAMIAMADSVGASSIAEGVENMRQAQFLRDAGCRLAQGYFYSAPVSAEEIEGMVEMQWSLEMDSDILPAG